MKIAPIDNLYRGRAVTGTTSQQLRSAAALQLEQRAAGAGAADSTTLAGHFAVFDVWTEIHSWFEGDFLERLAPGAFTKTIKESRDQIKVQYDHGFDAHVGDSPLGPIDVLREDGVGAYYEVPLLDTDYNRDRILPLLRGRLLTGEDRGSLLGASFRFRVTKEEWDEEPGKSDHNPDGLPERTIREVRLFEFGPVVFPAYPEATAGVRSLTDHYLERRRAQAGASDPALDDPAGEPATASETTDEPATGHSTDPVLTGRSVLALRASIHRHRRIA